LPPRTKLFPYTTLFRSDDKLKVLKLALDKIEKDYGKGSVMMLGDKQAVNIETISTGSLGLDVALGVGGFPRGRIIEIYGPESSRSEEHTSELQSRENLV